ncbi:uncharacterized protein LOC103709741 [Phoenix dactylifera]|uniref:Uncharacterized protein LOC103709741 n=1 Tax=Phoenix dactylifera TaxID=42345 RepID=A0A8B7C7K3_PHODC|nr:uncharacterized protein LOC103709741 [Phoenix dactylifera]
MENTKAILALSSPSESLAPEAESQISSLLCDVSQQLQIAIQNMLKMTSEIDETSAEIMEEIEKSKESAGVKNKILEEEKERFQKAAIAVLEMLNGSNVN